MVLTYRTGAAGEGGKGMADYLGAQADVPELAAKLSAYLGSGMAPATAGQTAAIPRRDMHPLMAARLGIDPNRSLSLEEMANILAGHRSDGAAIPGKRIFRSTDRKTRLAYTDFTFSAPKSFSIALVMAPTDAERAILEECWVRANDALMDHVASQIGVVLDKDGKVAERGHVAIVRYDHYTSRPTVRIATDNDTELVTVPATIPGDMQRHTHNIVPNVCITDDGRVRALPLEEMRERLHEWGAIGHAYLATFLRETGIGVDLDPKTGLSRLPDVPRRACELFQNRADDGEAHARKYAAGQGLDWDALDPKAKSAMLKNRVAATRRAKDGTVDHQAWLERAAKAGYRHQSVLRPEQKHGLADKGGQIKAAYAAALPMLEDEYVRRAKLDGSVVRTMAARGLIVSGIETPRDVDRVTAAFRTEGIRQDGRMTAVVWGGEPDKRYASVTTELHEELEREAIALLRAAAADKSAALSPARIDAAIARVALAKGYDFANVHGRKQAAMARAFAAAGRAIVGIGAAGAGKTVALEPVIDAYHAEGWQSYGVTLAWRQTHGLKDAGVGRQSKHGFNRRPDTDRLTGAGIGEDRAFALSVFLKRASAGELALDDRTLVVVDEIATVGTRQILDLARLRAAHGFKIVGMGDDKQCQAVEAGATIKLFRHALGDDQVPAILDTVRQKREEDRETALLFRSGKEPDTLEALKRKDAAGLLHLTPGGYADAVKAGVDEWERRTVANENRPDYRLGISVPTNADAHAVGVEIRHRQRAKGIVTGNDVTIQAQDQRGTAYTMDIAVGDTVRLFSRVNARFGETSRGYFGENGTTAEIVSIDVMEGLRLKRADGKTGFVQWASLQDKDTGRMRLAYGSALTVDARQGDTLTDHITILPAGTRALNAFKMYPADTRNREDSVVVISHGAEKEEVRNRRPIGDPWLAEATDEQLRDAIRGNMARNLSRQPAKGLAVDFIHAGMAVFRGSVNGMQAAWHRAEQAAAQEREPDLANRFWKNREASAAVSLLTQLKHSSTLTNGAVRLLMHEEKPNENRHERRRQAAFTRKKAKRQMRRERHHDTTAAQAEFADALRHAGVSLKGEPIMDGRWHRARAEGDKGRKQSARYRGYLDHRPAGFVENFKTGFAKVWHATGSVSALSDAEIRRIAEARTVREAERRTIQDKAGKRAFATWAKGTSVARHDYLERKGVASHGLRQDRKGNLLVPLMDATGFVRNLQTIDRNGDKRFVKHARKHGLFAQIGEFRPEKPILIAEGYATAATMYEATGLPVIVAFDSGNLLPVATAIRAKHQDAKIVLAADNDHHLPRRESPLPNVGKEKAEAAAKAVDGVVVSPNFGPIEKRPLLEGASVPTDWNDFAALNGIQALREAVEIQLKQKGIVMAEANQTGAERPVTQADRDAARRRQAAAPQASQDPAVARAQREAQRQRERQRHNHGPSL